MTFHQLEKVLARAATNRAFRDEIASGDADLDELGLSEDEQSVLNELVASSGAGLDAVLNVVASVPTSAAAAPREAPVPPAVVPSPPTQHNRPVAAHNGSATPGVATGPTPAFALMTPHPHHPYGVMPNPAAPMTPTAWPAVMSPGVAVPMSSTVPPAQSTPSVLGIPLETHGPLPPGVPMAPAVPYPQPFPMAYPAPAAARPGTPVAMPTSMPTAVPTATHPTGPAGDPRVATPAAETNHSPHRTLDASDVGRPVVARLPFGMDVVK